MDESNIQEERNENNNQNRIIIVHKYTLLHKHVF